jgi:hypothetical protein
MNKLSIKWYLALAVLTHSPLAFAVNLATDNASLQTWWHKDRALKADKPLPDNAVRQSPFYDVRVATAAAPAHQYSAFTYLSIPRGGMGKAGYDGLDGAEFAAKAKLTMSWASFLYSEDAWVLIKLKDGHTIRSIDEVAIRPSTLDFEKELVNENTIRVRVPYSPNGYRFSVEFQHQLYTAYNDMSGWSGELNDQAVGRNIHTEPRNAMLVFAEPMLNEEQTRRLVPTAADGSIHYPAEGLVDKLDAVSEEIIYFKPGVYYMGGNRHARLPANVKWVYLAPGAYVKGAFEFVHDNQPAYKVTGYGVISGEQYVYEPDTNNGYQHRTAPDCHGSCVKLLRLASSPQQQTLDLQGVTFANPPYHSFVVYGWEETMEMRVEGLKQVGGWYWQTDGIELYSNGSMKNTFFHANDDVLKMYHNNTKVENTVIWKNENGPVIQWGWSPRNLQNVHVKDTYVIHNKMYWKDVKSNTCVLNAAPSWSDRDAPPNPGTTVSNLYFENIHVEGTANCALRLYALSNTESVHIKNLQIDSWNGLDAWSQQSHFKRLSDRLSIGNESWNSRGLKLENYTVGGIRVSKWNDTWRDSATGRLNFDGELWDSWNAW